MQELIECLNEQLNIYESLHKKTLTEKDAYMKRDNDLLMSVLEDRLNLMNSLNELELKLKPLREKWINEKDSFDEDFNSQVIALAKKIKDLMDDILVIENNVIEHKMKSQGEVKGIVKSKAINRYKKI